MQTRPEELRRHAMLLAPAGNLDAAAEAFRAGADSVYVGLKGWSRGGARGELDAEQLLRCIALARALGKKVELAVNTIPKPHQRDVLLRQQADPPAFPSGSARGPARPPHIATN